MPLSPSEQFGPYEILSPLGAGGMGEVYRGHDTRLRRDVAIKVSAERFSELFKGDDLSETLASFTPDGSRIWEAS